MQNYSSKQLSKLLIYSKKPTDLIIKFGSDESDKVEKIFMHPNFFKTVDTLQDNIVRILIDIKTISDIISTKFQALIMLDREIPDVDLPCISKSNIDNSRCHVYSWAPWRFAKNFENSMKVDNVEVFTKGECYTSHLIDGKRHEKYVSRGNNNICVGSVNQYELDIVSFVQYSFA